MSIPVHIYVSYIASTPEKVWEALTSPAVTPLYFFGRRVDSDWQVGSPFRMWQEDGTLDVQGRVLEADAPRRLSVTWHVEWNEEFRHLPEVIVTYQIDDLGGLVRLTMTESHPTPIDPKYHKGGCRGWPLILSGLKSYLETGRQLPPFDMARAMSG